MPIEIFLALVGFAFVSSITPGPNNIMLLSSGVNFGFKRTIPHMLGISFGFCVLLICVGFGLKEIFEQFPILQLVLKILGALYLLYLAYSLVKSSSVKSIDVGAKPMSFLEAALFQWVNVKAWVMAIYAMSFFTGLPDFVSSVFIIATVFTIINLPCVSVWCVFGVGLRKFLDDPKRLQQFNYLMAFMLVATLWPMLS